MMLDPKFEHLSVSQKAALLGIHRRSYYKWVHQLPPNPKMIQEEMRLRDEMQKIALEFPGYGYRRVTVELHNRGYPVNHKKVLRLMEEDNLLCVRKKFKPLTTDSNHPHKVYPNLLRYQKITHPNQGGASDITYIHLQDMFAYLAVIIDVYSRKCIGWQLGTYLDTQLTLGALHIKPSVNDGIHQ